jgi:hypothetical protein
MGSDKLTPRQRAEQEIRRSAERIEERRKRGEKRARKRRHREIIWTVLITLVFVIIACGSPLLSLEGPGVFGVTIQHEYKPDFKADDRLGQYLTILEGQFKKLFQCQSQADPAFMAYYTWASAL